MAFILETPRLVLREMGQADLPALRKILQDPQVMYAYEHAFSEAEVQDWFQAQLRRYREDGVGLWAVCRRENTGEMIGQCGLTWQNAGGHRMREIGYLFQKQYWHKGYATEAAVACKRYAFDVLGDEEVCSIIRDTNAPSQAVARRNGMLPAARFVKYYYGIDMPHIVFVVHRKTGA